MKNAHYYLQRCLALAKWAAEKGNSSVGAVVVKDDEIISEAEEAVKTKNDISCHAEMEAIRQAVKILNTNDLSACILYSTQREPLVLCVRGHAIRFYKITSYLSQSIKIAGSAGSFIIYAITYYN